MIGRRPPMKGFAARPHLITTTSPLVDRRSKLPGSGHRRCWSSCNVETLTMKRLTDRNEWSTVKSHREVSNRRLTLQADSYSSPNSHIFYGTWSALSLRSSIVSSSLLEVILIIKETSRRKKKPDIEDNGRRPLEEERAPGSSDRRSGLHSSKSLTNHRLTLMGRRP